MALTQGRNTEELANNARHISLPMSKTVIYGGAMVAVDEDGFAVAARQESGLVAVGRAEETVDNTGDIEGMKILVKRGVFRWDNDPVAANMVTQEHLMKDCYILDDCTVTSEAEDSSVAGKVIAVSSDGVYVQMG